MKKIYRYSKEKFNKVFLPKLILYSMPGIIAFLIIGVAKSIDSEHLITINVNTYIAYFVVLIDILSVSSLIFVLPAWFFGRLSQYRRSYLTIENGKITYTFWKTSLPFLGADLLIHEVENLKDLKVTSKKIVISGQISKRKINSLSSNKNVKVNIINKLVIPNVFENTEELKLIKT